MPTPLDFIAALDALRARRVERLAQVERVGHRIEHRFGRHVGLRRVQRGRQLDVAGAELAAERQPVLDGAVGIGVARLARRQLLERGGEHAHLHELRCERGDGIRSDNTRRCRAVTLCYCVPYGRRIAVPALSSSLLGLGSAPARAGTGTGQPGVGAAAATMTPQTYPAEQIHGGAADLYRAVRLLSRPRRDGRRVGARPDARGASSPKTCAATRSVRCCAPDAWTRACRRSH